MIKLRATLSRNRLVVFLSYSWAHHIEPFHDIQELHAANWSWREITVSNHTERASYQKDMSHLSSHLFLVRVWLGKNAKGAREARLYGRVQDVSTGQAHYFRGGSELAKILRHMIPQSHIDRSDGTKKDTANKDRLADGSV